MYNLQQRDRAAVRLYGLREFVRLAWCQFEPARFVAGWHVDAICEHLTAFHERQFQDLVINQPPSTSKSTIASVLFPAWVWTLDPSHGFICASYDNDLALRDARKMRTLITSDWYHDRWPDVRLPYNSSASKAVGIYETTAGGLRLSVTPRGGITGKHGDTHIYDDLIDPLGADLTSGLELSLVHKWLYETMPTRFRDQRTRGRVLIMQRLHEADPTADFIRDGATVLCLPMRFDKKHPHRYARDPRIVDGELLEPTRFPESVVASLEKTLGPRATACQFQQLPSQAGGGLFQHEWLTRYWVDLPPGGMFTQSWDAAFKAEAGSSLVAGQLWYKVGANFYLVERDTGHKTFTETIAAIESMCARCPECHEILIEDKANGPAIESVLHDKIPGIVMITPEGGKVSRANATEPLFAAGNVLLPDPELARYRDGRRGADWVPTFQHVMETFPVGVQDDDVDACTQYLNYAAGSWTDRYMANWSKLQDVL